MVDLGRAREGARDASSRCACCIADVFSGSSDAFCSISWSVLPGQGRARRPLLMAARASRATGDRLGAAIREAAGRAFATAAARRCRRGLLLQLSREFEQRDVLTVRQNANAGPSDRSARLQLGWPCLDRVEGALLLRASRPPSAICPAARRWPRASRRPGSARARPHPEALLLLHGVHRGTRPATAATAAFGAGLAVAALGHRRRLPPRLRRTEC